MNIFAIEKTPGGDIDWVKSAQSQDDLRVVKMTLETAQLLCSALNILTGYQCTRYRTAHKNHPCTIWARQSLANWLLLKRHGLALAEEYTRRFGKTHKSEYVMRSLNPNQDLFHQLESTPLPLCMPDEFKSDDTVESYRRFYSSKPNMRYVRSQAPQWFVDMRSIPYQHIRQEEINGRMTTVVPALYIGEIDVEEQ